LRIVIIIIIISRLHHTTTSTSHGLQCCHHTVAGALYKNLDLKLLHSSMQTFADHRSRRRHVSRMTDEKGETCTAIHSQQPATRLTDSEPH